MPFPKDCYDPETLGLMTKAFDAAWQEAEYARPAALSIQPVSAG